MHNIKPKRKSKEDIIAKILSYGFIFVIVFFIIRMVVHWFILNTWLSNATEDHAVPINPTDYDSVINSAAFIITSVILLLEYLSTRKPK